MAVRYYCPRCWEEIEETVARCPHCDFELADFQKQTYEKKILMALRHPVREYRMMAIRVLGDLGIPETVTALAGLLERENDYYVIREAVESLLKVGGPEAIREIRRLQDHPSDLVRKLAHRTLCDVSSASPPHIEEEETS